MSDATSASVSDEPTYRDFLRHFESTGQRFNDSLKHYMDAADTDYTVAFTDPWREDMRELARGMLMYPELVLRQQPPPEFATLYALYQQWAGRYLEMAYRVLDLVSALDRCDMVAAGDAIQRVVGALKVVSALTEARAIYMGSLSEQQ